MSKPITQIPKPEASQYSSRRKLLLIPAYIFSPEAPEEGKKILEDYWAEVEQQIVSLETSLGSVAQIYHEGLCYGGETAIKVLDGLNPNAKLFIQRMCASSSNLVVTEERTLMEVNADWQRCITVGLMSEAVRGVVLEGYQDSTKKRFEHIAKTIDETLKEKEVGVLFIREDHKVQFPADIQVFYVAPPSLDALKRWIENQVRAVSENIDKENPSDKDKEKA